MGHGGPGGRRKEEDPQQSPPEVQRGLGPHPTEAEEPGFKLKADGCHVGGRCLPQDLHTPEPRATAHCPLSPLSPHTEYITQASPRKAEGAKNES